MSHGMVFASSGYYKFKHRPVGSSKITSPLAYGDYYYTLMDQGFLNCRDVITGEDMYDRN